VVDGLDGDRVGVIERIHHAMADGLAGVELAMVLFDADTGVEAGTPAVDPWDPEEAPGPALGALEDLGRLAAVGRRWGGRGVRAARHPLDRLHGGFELAGALATVGTSGVLRPSTSINRAVSGHRSVDLVRQPLAELRGTARTLGVTVNDLVLTAVGGGVARLLRRRGDAAPGDVQVLVPVGLDPGDRHALGNKVSAWFVRVPVGTDAPLARLKSVSASTGRARSRHEELAAEVALDLLSPVPQPVVGCLSRLANHQPFFNLVVTNVPGPPEPLFLLGARLLEAYPFVPLAGNLTFGVAVLSYDGYLSFGVLADPETCPDASDFARGLREELASLVAAAGCRPAPAPGHPR
jgi:WS/DGAT/MGAT family acyltransferase